MSGISGILRLDGRPADPAEIERMLAAIAHRGPDGERTWCSGPVALGHRLLATVSHSSRGSLHGTTEAGAVVVTADLRIDNRAELASALDLDPAERNASDDELLLRAYERWGEECPRHLVGDFAFALWDGRRRTFFCARDPFGVRPFYYFASSRLFCFASEAKALFTLPEVPREIDERSIGDYLAGIFEDPSRTFFRAVLRLPPAHTATIGADGCLRLQRYWSLDPDREIRLRSDKEYAEAFRDLFTEAVRCRLRTEGRIGSMLSGGLDSSAIVCVARALRRREGGDEPLRTFSLVFDDVPECDEREFIEEVLAGGDIEPCFVRGDRLDPLGDLDEILNKQDEPFPAPNLFLHRGSYRAAGEAGVRVLLDGLDGDTTVSHGIPRLAELARSGRWLALVAEARGLSRNFGVPWASILLNHGLRPLVPGPLRALRRSLRTSQGRRLPGIDLIAPSFAARIGLREQLESAREQHAQASQSVRQEHWKRLTWGLLPLALEVADKAASPFGIEPRYPFFDRRLVEFCLALPADQKLSGGWTRLVMRRALEGILPPKIQWRGGKSNLAPNFDYVFSRFGRPTLNRLVLSPPASFSHFVDLDAFCEGCRSLGSSGKHPDTVVLWRTTVLGAWLAREERRSQETTVGTIRTGVAREEIAA